MNLHYRQGTINDIDQMKSLAIRSWSRFSNKLSPENWNKLYSNLTDENTYRSLVEIADSIVCATANDEIIGMAFLVPRGNPTDIYENDWCYIRFLTVDPAYGGQGIGRKLTEQCIEVARHNNETFIALHTSELMNNARHIYESMGFTILREIDKRLGMRYWLYGKEII